MNYVRRGFLLEAGEPLLLARSPISLGARVGAFSEESGIDASNLLMDPMMALPIPLFNKIEPDPLTGQARRRWAGTRPEIMWHPLMWLPERVAKRYTIQGPTGSALESNSLWAARVALEMTASGLYDPTEASWLDVLAIHGIDVGDELDRYRIQDWLNGMPDETLDAIDLDEYLGIADEDWAVRSAMNMMPSLTGASFALQSDTLLDTVDDVNDPLVGVSAEVRLSVLTSVASIATGAFAETGAVTEDGIDTGTGGIPHATFFTDVHAFLAAQSEISPYQLKDTAAQMSDRLFAIREAYWPYVDLIVNPTIPGSGSPAATA